MTRPAEARPVEKRAVQTGAAEVGARRWVGRYSLVLLYSSLAGMAPGAISGSIVPLFGTLIGALVGVPVGAAATVVVAPLIARRDLGRAFGVMITSSMLVAAVWVVLGWASALTGWASDVLPAVYTFVAVPMTILTYLGGAWWAQSRYPAVWPSHRAGTCWRCGYSLEGLRDWVCPECGHDNERKRLAQPA